MRLFLFNMIRLLSPEETFGKWAQFLLRPTGGILQGSNLDLCFILFLGGLNARSVPYYPSSEGINVY